MWTRKCGIGQTEVEESGGTVAVERGREAGLEDWDLDGGQQARGGTLAKQTLKREGGGR